MSQEVSTNQVNNNSESTYIYQMWAVTTWIEDGKSRKARCLLGLYTTEEKLKDAAKAMFQDLLEDTENRYIHVYGVMTPTDTLFDPEDTVDLEYGLKIDRRKRSAGCLFIANTAPV